VGLDQIVLLGAGFDARGLRMPEIAARRATVYEIDTTEQLARKRKVLAAAGIKVPAIVRYVPFDFDTANYETDLAAALEAAGFRCRGGAIFVWEGGRHASGSRARAPDEAAREELQDGCWLDRARQRFAEGRAAFARGDVVYVTPDDLMDGIESELGMAG
jgi:leucine carboxyl methyltransferase